jgi:hypothetical protein
MEDPIDHGWRKSSYSGNGGGDCVEVGRSYGGILVRDSKDRPGPILAVAFDAWITFTDRVKRSLDGPNRFTGASFGTGCPFGVHGVCFTQQGTAH